MNLSSMNPTRRARRGQRFGLSAGAQGGRSLDATKLEAAYVGYHTLLHDRIAKSTGLAARVAKVLQTDNVLDRQVWLQNNPKARQWIGDKVLHKLRAESHPVTTSPHEASTEIPKNDLLNDRYGMYRDRINGLGDAYTWALDDMVAAALAAGIAGTSLGATYDGQNLIDTDHTALSGGGTAQTNRVNGALSAANYALAYRRYLEILDENGVPLNVAGRAMKLVVGPANRDQGRAIIEQSWQTGGAQNIDAGTAELVVTPWLAARTTNVLGTSVTITGTEWALIPEDSSAILVHVKRAVEFLSVEDGEYVFRTGQNLYGIEFEMGFCYGMWQEIVGGPGA